MTAEISQREREIDKIVVKVEEGKITNAEGIHHLCNLKRSLRGYVKNFDFSKYDANYKKTFLKMIKRAYDRIKFYCDTWEYEEYEKTISNKVIAKVIFEETVNQ